MSPPPQSLFLSYARDDDEPFVSRLYQDLTAAGFEVWWDRARMPSRALTFLHEIQLAIDACTRLVFVVGPKALSSPYVRAEWRYALETGKAINPVLRTGDYDLLPAELRLVDTPDFRLADDYAARLTTLLRQLREPVAPLGRLANVPGLPPHFLPRPDELGALKDRVLAGLRHPSAVTRAARRTAIVGMGGIGKSALAAALANDHEIRRAFPAGVYWLTLGQTPKVLVRQSQLAERLGDSPRAFADPEQARARLTELIGPQACLLILDDVWQMDAVAAFDALGNRGHLLFTTRDANLATGCGAMDLRLEPWTHEQAMELLARWSACRVDALPPAAAEVGRECGFLPLALAMVGARVRGDATGWDNVLHRLRSADLARIRQQFPHYPYPDLLRAIQVSVDALQPADRRARYLEIAVFPEAVPIPEAALRNLWGALGMDEYDVQDALKTFVNLSLLNYEERSGYTLHTLLHDFIRKECERELPTLHERLLAAYRERNPGGWTSITDDGYLPKNLFHHLIEANHTSEICELLAFNPHTGEIPWLAAMKRWGKGSFFRQDVDQAAEWAGRELATTWAAEGFSRLIYYTLVRASLTTISDALPPELPALLVSTGQWTEDEAIQHVQSLWSPAEQILGMTALARLKSTEEERIHLLILAMAWATRGIRTDALDAFDKVGELLSPAANDYFSRFVQFIENPASRLNTVLKLLPHQTPEHGRILAGQALELLRSLSPQTKDRLAEKFLRESHLGRTSTCGTQEDAYRRFEARILAGLVNFLSEAEAPKVLVQGLAIVDSITHPEPRMEALTYFLPLLPIDERWRRVEDTLTDTSQIGYELLRSRFILAAAANADPHHLEVAQEKATQLPSEYWRAMTLIGLVRAGGRMATESEGEGWLAALSAEKYESWKAELLAELITVLPPELLGRVLPLTATFTEPESWTQILSQVDNLALVMTAPAGWFASLYAQAERAGGSATKGKHGWKELRLWSEAQPSDFRKHFFSQDRRLIIATRRRHFDSAAQVAAHLPVDAQRRIVPSLLTRCLSVGDGVERLALQASLLGLAPQLYNPTDLERFISELKVVHEDWVQAWLLARLSVHLSPEKSLPLMLRAIHLIEGKDTFELSVGLEVARSTPEPERSRFLDGFVERHLAALAATDSTANYLRAPRLRRLAEACTLLNDVSAQRLATRILSELGHSYSGEAIMVVALLAPFVLWDADNLMSYWINESLTVSVGEGLLALLAILPRLTGTQKAKFLLLLEAALPGVACDHCRKILRAGVMPFLSTIPLPDQVEAICAIKEDALFVEALNAFVRQRGSCDDDNARAILPLVLNNLAHRPRAICLTALAEWMPIIFRVGGQALIREVDDAVNQVAQVWA